MIHAETGKVLHKADYSDFAQASSHATKKPAENTAVSGEISRSEAISIADSALKAQYGGFDRGALSVEANRFDSMPGYSGPVFRINYFAKEGHAYTCIVQAKNGAVLYHSDVGDASMTEIDYSTPTPAPEYESTVDIGRSRARSIADSHLAGKYPHFASSSFSAVKVQFVTKGGGGFETPHYQFDYYEEGQFAFEVIVHAWTGKILYSWGDLPGEANG